MNIQLLQWGLICFMSGLALSLPLAAVYYGKNKNSRIKQVITNPRKLKSAHLDYFMQALSLGFVYLLELVQKDPFPLYVVVPLIFGAIGNPSVLFIESTPFHRSRLVKSIHKLIRSLSRLSLLFAFSFIALHFLPSCLTVLVLGFLVLMGLVLIFTYRAGLT